MFALAALAPVARAQAPAPAAAEDPTQQQLDKLSAQIQDIQDAQAAQGKRLDDLEKKITDLTDKLGQPGSTGSVSADDVKKLAEQVQEIDKKRQADNEAIVKELEKLDRALGVAPSKGKASTPVATSGGNDTPAGGPQKGYYYTIAKGDNLSLIAKAYRTQGVNVTAEQIRAANPGINPNGLIVGKKIFIPDPNAK